MKITRRKFIESIGYLGVLYLLAPGKIVQGNLRFLRPPGAVPEEEFNTKCIRCFKCGQTCPTGAIQFGGWADGQAADTPILTKLRTNPCSLCMECTKVCPTGALMPIEPELESIGNTVKIGVAQISVINCVIYTGERPRCHLCMRVCPFQGDAIYLDNLGRPVINEDRCVGCGLCEQACPLDPAAIEVRGMWF